VITRTEGPQGTSYSNVVSAAGPGRLLFVSGQLPVDAGGAPVAGGMGAQATACLRAVVEAVRAHGGDAGNVVRIESFLTDLEAYGEFAAARAEVFGDEPPASVAVGVDSLLAGALVEVSAIAYLPEGEHGG
jgi:2-iminobutanoate/2-iminopropanoate deaminase